MKILVTGGLGFIGSNFILQILKNHRDCEIVNVDAEFFGSNHENLIELRNYEKYRYVKGNIIDEHLMKKLISECDSVVNFAAESFVDRSIVNAVPFLESNVNGVLTILDIIKEQKKKFVQISTDEVFGSLQNGNADENFPFNPSSPYAATKASAELLIKSFFTTYDCNCVITRSSNNYGPKQFPEKLIPKVIILASKNRKIPIYGTGKNIRDWIFVEDNCDAIIKILFDGKAGKSYNISANNEVDNITIVKKILSYLNKNEDLIEFVSDRPGHDFRYSMNSSKIRNETGWSQKTNFQEGLEKTIKWYVTNNEWWENIPEKTFNPMPWKNSS